MTLKCDPHIRIVTRWNIAFLFSNQMFYFPGVGAGCVGAGGIDAGAGAGGVGSAGALVGTVTGRCCFGRLCDLQFCGL